MVVSPFVVVLDANVLFPFVLRDTLLRAAEADFYAARWSDQILNEATRNLVASGRMPPEGAARLAVGLGVAFPDAKVDGYEDLIPAMRNHQGDRHVAAVAVKAGAQVIVTSNLKHFQNLPEGIEAQSPDEFLCHLFGLAPEAFPNLLARQAAALLRPPWTMVELLVALRQTVPGFVRLIEAELGKVRFGGYVIKV